MFLLAIDAEAAAEAGRRMAMIGLDRVDGWMNSDAVAEYEARHDLARIRTTDTDDAAQAATDPARVVLDVRSAREFSEGHIPGAVHVPLGDLCARIAEVPDKPLVVHCGSGGRSHIATTLLLGLGRNDVLNYEAGFNGYACSGHPVGTGTPT